ncbi:MAG: hypothetical protein KGV59_01325 [Tenacibaculum sp.]|nr:hypothetical protein [Tenacibaculum sp.]
MSLRLIYNTVVISKSTIKNKYKGGLEKFRNDITYGTFQEDNELISVSFMNPNDAYWYCCKLNENGLHYNKDENYSTDFVRVCMIMGKSWKADWLEVERRDFWLKGVLPTHTCKVVWRKHKVFNNDNELCIWWNNLNDAWKNILYYNYKYNDVEDKVKTLYHKMPYYIQFIVDINENDLEKMILMEEIWISGLKNEGIREIKNLIPLKYFKNLKNLAWNVTNLEELLGVEDLINLEHIGGHGHFSDIYRLNKLKKLKSVFISSKNIKSIKSLYNLKLEYLNINHGDIPNRNEFIEYKKNNPKCFIDTSFGYSIDFGDIPNRRINVE